MLIKNCGKIRNSKQAKSPCKPLFGIVPCCLQKRQRCVVLLSEVCCGNTGGKLQPKWHASCSMIPIMTQRFTQQFQDTSVALSITEQRLALLLLCGSQIAAIQLLLLGSNLTLVDGLHGGHAKNVSVINPRTPVFRLSEQSSGPEETLVITLYKAIVRVDCILSLRNGQSLSCLQDSAHIADNHRSADNAKYQDDPEKTRRGIARHLEPPLEVRYVRFSGGVYVSPTRAIKNWSREGFNR